MPFLVHLLFLIVLSAYTCFFIDASILPTYLTLSFIFLLSTILSLSMIINFETGIFNYILNILFALGFWFKYSIHKITATSYPEPIGSFIQNPSSEIGAIRVVIYGILGFFLSQIISYYLLRKYSSINKSIEESRYIKSTKTLFVLIFMSIFKIN